MRSRHLFLTIFLASLTGYSQNIVSNPFLNEVNPTYLTSNFYSGGFDSEAFNFLWNSLLDTTEQVRQVFVVSFTHRNSTTPYSLTGSLNFPPNPQPYHGDGYFNMTLKLDSNQVYSTPPKIVAPSMIYNTLKNELVAGVEYCVEFHVQPIKESPYSWLNPCYFTDDIGVYFKQDTITSGSMWLDNVAPHVFNTNGIIDNIQHWTKIQGSFVAQGGEQYMFVSSFNSPWKDMYSNSTNQCGPINEQNYAMYHVGAFFVYDCRDTLYDLSLNYPDTTICFGESLELAALRDGFKLEDTVVTYQWYRDGFLLNTTDSFLTANVPGQYRVVMDINRRYTQEAEMTLSWYPEEPQERFIPENLELCFQTSEVIRPPELPFTTYQWSTGDTIPPLRIANPGMYTLTVSNPCWQREESVVADFIPCGASIWIPDAFTPDGDGLNDVYEIIGSPFPLHLTVFDRWGSVVFDGEDYQNNWNGTYPSGEPVPEGVYTYHVRYYTSEFGGQKSRFGSLRVFRTQ